MYLKTLTLSLFFFVLPLPVPAVEHRLLEDIEFAKVGDHSLKLDLYLPAKTENPPLVIWIHGGGWRKGDKGNCRVAWLADHGFAIASISYRLTGVAKFPAQIHDCKAAVRWLRTNADKYGYQKDKIAVAGSSAGGHLATLLGTSGGVEELEGEVGGNLDQSSRVQAVIDFYGATDFILRSETQPSRANEEGSVVFELLGGGADKKVKLAGLASPAFHVTADDPPLLIFHGSTDKTVLVDQSERIYDVYTAAKLPVSLRVLVGAGHGGDRFYTGNSRRRAVEFLDSVLKR